MSLLLAIVLASERLIFSPVSLLTQYISVDAIGCTVEVFSTYVVISTIGVLFVNVVGCTVGVFSTYVVISTIEVLFVNVVGCTVGVFSTYVVISAIGVLFVNVVGCTVGISIDAIKAFSCTQPLKKTNPLINNPNSINILN